jgi:hypothetical protein
MARAGANALHSGRLDINEAGEPAAIKLTSEVQERGMKVRYSDPSVPTLNAGT